MTTKTHSCKDNTPSANETWWEYDGRGIPLCRVCDDCRDQKLSRYRPEILRHYTQDDVDEPIEADDGYDYSDVYDF